MPIDERTFERQRSNRRDEFSSLIFTNAMVTLRTNGVTDTAEERYLLVAAALRILAGVQMSALTDLVRMDVAAARAAEPASGPKRIEGGQ